jgi:hypothetical protein
MPVIDPVAAEQDKLPRAESITQQSVRARSPSTPDAYRSNPTRPYNAGVRETGLTRLKTSRAAYRLRHRMISRRVLPSWVRRS